MEQRSFSCCQTLLWDWRKCEKTVVALRCHSWLLPVWANVTLHCCELALSPLARARLVIAGDRANKDEELMSYKSRTPSTNLLRPIPTL